MHLHQRQNCGDEPAVRSDLVPDCRSWLCQPDQPDDLEQIVQPEEGTTSGYDDERIRRNDVGPLRGDGLEVAIVVLEVHAVLIPGLAA